ncbi:hypothetical protein ACKWTF_006014 [Chironomus riparius]
MSHKIKNDFYPKVFIISLFLEYLINSSTHHLIVFIIPLRFCVYALLNSLNQSSNLGGRRVKLIEKTDRIEGKNSNKLRERKIINTNVILLKIFVYMFMWPILVLKTFLLRSSF